MFVREASSLEMFLYIAIIGCLFISWLLKQTPPNLPPGPWGIPLFGYYPFVNKKPRKTFTKLSEKYGNIFSINFGRRRVVVLNGYNMIRQAYLKQGMDFDGRPEHSLYKEDEETMFFVSEGTTWVDFRRYGTTSLRDFGLGKNELEPLIHEELHVLMKTLKSMEGKPVDIRKPVRMAIHNIMNVIVFGYRFDYNDDKYDKFCQELIAYQLLFDTIASKLFSPFHLQRIMESLGIISVKQDSHPFFSTVLEFINNDLEKTRPNDAVNFIRAWMQEYERRSPNTRKHLTKEHLKVFLGAIYIGSEAAATVMLWNIMYLMQHSHVQRKLQKEIDIVVGSERMPSQNDKPNMPYVEATSHECDRTLSLTPMILNHMASKSTTLGGYNIPKGTVIMANVWSVHNDPQTFPNPEHFNPERFLDDKGKAFKPPELIPFSLGRRQCPGELLARKELYLLTTTLFQHFTIEIPDGQSLNFDCQPGTTQTPYPFEVVLKSRH